MQRQHRAGFEGIRGSKRDDVRYGFVAISPAVDVRRIKKPEAFRCLIKLIRGMLYPSKFDHVVKGQFLYPILYCLTIMLDV